MTRKKEKFHWLLLQPLSCVINFETLHVVNVVSMSFFVRKGVFMKKRTMTLAILLVLALCPIVWGADSQQTPTNYSEHDQLRIAVQEICPVSGAKLGSMGDPVKVAIGEAKEEIFLCCAGCAKGKISPEHWATIHTNIARAQGKCPIMKKDLPESAKWTVVGGELIYVCCPPCIKKINANPEAAISLVDTYYTAYLQEKQLR